MADKTKIEWTDATWNPITGCAVVSPGCTNCYAMKLAGTRLRNIPSRVGLTRATKAGPVWTGEIRFNEAWLDEPLRYRRPRMIFVCAHGDLFAEGVTDEMLDRVFAVMALAPQHTFQVLTKRPERMRDYLSAARAHPVGLAALEQTMRSHSLNPRSTVGSGVKLQGDIAHLSVWPLPNVWLGVSAEDQRRADERIPVLLDTPAAVRWVSAEPLLGSIDLFSPEMEGPLANGEPSLEQIDGPNGMHFVRYGASRLDWVVAGGESGHGARPMHPDWPRMIRDQCATAGVPFLFKQWGEWAPICEMSEEAVDRCYRSNRRAREGESQETMDEMHGRTCIVKKHVLHHDGSQHDVIAPRAFLQGTGAMSMFRIGKPAAGRRLDGVLHDAYPQSEEIVFG